MQISKEERAREDILQNFEHSATGGDFKTIFSLADKLKKCEKHDEIYIIECEFCKKESDEKNNQ